MNRSDALEVLDAVENGMIKLGQSREIWQNDLVYTALQGVRLLMLDAIKKRPETPKEDDHTPVVRCKDCVYYSGFGGCQWGECTLAKGWVHGTWTHEDDHCASGKKEKNGNGK